LELGSGSDLSNIKFSFYNKAAELITGLKFDVLQNFMDKETSDKKFEAPFTTQAELVENSKFAEKNFLIGKDTQFSIIDPKTIGKIET
jgi:hypothetical protein